MTKVAKLCFRFCFALLLGSVSCVFKKKVAPFNGEIVLTAHSQSKQQYFTFIALISYSYELLFLRSRP